MGLKHSKLRKTKRVGRAVSTIAEIFQHNPTPHNTTFSQTAGDALRFAINLDFDSEEETDSDTDGEDTCHPELWEALDTGNPRDSESPRPELLHSEDVNNPFLPLYSPTLLPAYADPIQHSRSLARSPLWDAAFEIRAEPGEIESLPADIVDGPLSLESESATTDPECPALNQEVLAIQEPPPSTQTTIPATSLASPITDHELQGRHPQPPTSMAPGHDHQSAAVEDTIFNMSTVDPRVRLPEPEDVAAAKLRIEYDPQKLHFAVCGAAGSGKSSIINALRGLNACRSEAAESGAVETTSEIGRYPDTRTELPYNRFVWYDIPGAGTLEVTSSNYFRIFGLFVFDFIVLVYDVRFTEIDRAILEEARRFDIPVFLVRSKSDQHIRNEVEKYDDEDEQYIRNSLWEREKRKYIEATEKNARKNLEKMAEQNPDLQGIQDEQRVYIVNRAILRRFVSTKKEKDPDPMRIIHEVELLGDMLLAAMERRYPDALKEMEQLGAMLFLAMNRKNPEERAAISGPLQRAKVIARGTEGKMTRFAARVCAGASTGGIRESAMRRLQEGHRGSLNSAPVPRVMPVRGSKTY